MDAEIRSWCPCHLTRSSSTDSTSSTEAIVDAAFSTTSGSIPSPSLRNIRRADRASSQKIGTATTKPATGSTQDCPNAEPTPAATTAREVSASVRACLPSVISASEPMDSPTRIRYRATNSLPIAPTMPAAITHGISSIRRASKRRCADSQMTRPAETAIARTMKSPAQSSALLNPYVYRLVAGQRPTAKAIHRGIAVNASVRL